MTKLCFVDTETTGLDPDRHEIWEVACIVRDAAGDTEFVWQLPVDLGRAEPTALRISRYHQRATQWREWDLDAPEDRAQALRFFAREFAPLTRGAHLVGAVISFDEERLRRLLMANGGCPEWHYHLVDVEALVAGKHGLEPPWDSDKLAELESVRPISDDDRHTALGDARWARDLYDAVMARAD